MDSFHDVRFPTSISFGATGGPERRVEIVALTSGREKRNLRFAHSRRHFDAGTGVRSLADLHEIVAFFEARRGSYHGFRFRDPFDMKSCAPDAAPAPDDQALGTGDGARADFQLVKRYGEGGDAYERPIRKPVAGTVRVAVDGVERAAPAQFSVDHATGIVTFAPGAVPAPGALVSAGFAFDIAARFDTERIAISLSAFKAGQIPSIPVIEIEP
ncbi:MAG: DUF2460 domain-containing protein [Aquamicrobium sp.]|uniref:phage distal tail protein, Rcc01695 family n=1 Tax=Aquamicrobium sp. TaxID=1872579 RepID=UPI00349E833F|nr:DUF2460 domain-containing protein [Aquamicrobium sp.]